MDAARFDRLSRSLSAVASRRGLLAGLSAPLGLLAIRIPGSVQAKKKKRKKVKKNQFGCVDVSKFCKNSGQCCSGICKGKKGKKKCKAHDQSTCQAGQTFEICGGADDPPTCTAEDSEGACFTTTGKAGFGGFGASCVACKRDVDCEPLCGPGAACIPCPAGCLEVDTVCAGANGTSCDVP